MESAESNLSFTWNAKDTDINWQTSLILPPAPRKLATLLGVLCPKKLATVGRIPKVPLSSRFHLGLANGRHWREIEARGV